MKWIKRILLVLVVLLVGAQFVRPDLTNPTIDPAKVLHAPANVQPILDRSCSDCHSNTTQWPWYSQISPLSWWLVDHVHEGRRELNFSEFASYKPRRMRKKYQEICEQVKEGEMPLWQYTPLHPDAKLSDADRQTLCTWSQGEMAKIVVPPGEPAPRREPGRD